jgi:hypothetical protein
VHDPAAHPAQVTHLPPAHSESLVHQQVTPAALHVPVGDATLSQLPVAHPQPLTAEVIAWQSDPSAVPLPVQVPVHWLFEFTHLPLEQSESATQRHAVCAALHTGVGEREVKHALTAADPALAFRYP